MRQSRDLTVFLQHFTPVLPTLLPKLYNLKFLRLWQITIEDRFLQTVGKVVTG